MVPHKQVSDWQNPVEVVVVEAEAQLPVVVEVPPLAAGWRVHPFGDPLGWLGMMVVEVVANPTSDRHAPTCAPHAYGVMMTLVVADPPAAFQHPPDEDGVIGGERNCGTMACWRKYNWQSFAQIRQDLGMGILPGS